jgi:RimJ/RimL family protein N-acetyltransferase
VITDGNEFEFLPLTPPLLSLIEPWFDDSDTERYLGRREWAQRELDLVVTSPGTKFRGRLVTARYAWVVHLTGRPVAFVVVELYDDASAGIAFVVAPSERGRGVCRGMLSALDHRPELKGVKIFAGATEPGNLPARRAVQAAGFAVARLPDDEGMLRFQRARVGD